MSRVIYICSPLRGNPPYSMEQTEQNRERTIRYCAMAVNQGYIPVAPHLYFPLFLNDGDPQKRQQALEDGLALLERCDEVWVFAADGVSDGMKLEIQHAREKKIPLRFSW